VNGINLEDWKQIQKEFQLGKEYAKLLSEFENEQKQTTVRIELNLHELNLIYAQLQATALLTKDMRSANLASKILEVLEKHWKRMKSHKKIQKFIQENEEVNV